jgi:uncharacterized protein DUF5655
MARWTCPRCDREFGRTNQSHTCLPGNSVDATFRGRPEQRAVYDAIAKHLKSLGPYHADAVQVGVFVKSDRKLAELRPKSKWLELTLYLDHDLVDRRVAKSVRYSAVRVISWVKLRAPEEVDDQLCAWLTEAYDLATD